MAASLKNPLVVPIGLEQTQVYKVQVDPLLKTVPVSMDVVIQQGERPVNPYEGPYTVVPSAHNEIILSTKDHYMERDVTVFQIPYYETFNLSDGYTAYIGGEV